MEPEKMKRYRVTGPRGSEWAGIEIEVHESSNEDELLKEVRTVYDGKVVSAKDLDVF